MSEFGSSSGGNKNVERAKEWKTFFEAQPTESSSSLASTGSGQPAQSQSTGLEVSGYGFYAIADAVEEFAAAGGNAGVMTLDCISVPWFWETLLANSTSYEPLQFSSVTEEQTARRNALLQSMVPVEQTENLANRRMVLIFIPARKIPDFVTIFPPGTWININIECGVTAASDVTALFETDPTRLSDPKFVVTHSLFDRFARTATDVEFIRPLQADETAFLEEIFSLNHIRNAELSDGTATPPPLPVPSPIVLDEGGFTFDGSDSFWTEAKLLTTGELDEETIQPWNVPGKAQHRSTGMVYDVVKGDETATEGAYTLTLENEKDGFELSLAPDGSGKIVTECVLLVGVVEVDQNEELLVAVTKGNDVFQPEDPVPNLFTLDSSSSSGALPLPLPPTPKKATRRRRIDPQGIQPLRLDFSEKSQQTEKGGKSFDSSAADKENVHPNLVNIATLPTLIRKTDRRAVHLSPSKRYWR